MVESVPAKQKMGVRSLGQECALEKEMATHSSILAWRIPWTEDPGGLQSMRLQRVTHDLISSNNRMGDRSSHMKICNSNPF